MKLNIRSKLTLQFTGIVAFILLLFCTIIYYFSSSYRESEFYSRLQNKALTTARLLIEVKEVDNNLLRIIDRNTINALYNEKVVIYDFQNAPIYNSIDDDSIHISKQLLDRIRIEKEVRYHEGENEVLGLLYSDKLDRFVVVASALDKYGRRKLTNLRWILLFGFISSIGLTVFMGMVYAGRALKPMSDVINRVDRITISSLNLRVNEGNGSDEIAQLAIRFNKMLERLESAFEMQRNFVSNASHELRTPLTSITGQIEVSLMKPRGQQEYITILESILDDIRNLNELSNGLLDMARASSDISSISMAKLRIDELLWQTRYEFILRKSDYRISIQFNETIEDENNFMILGNEQLIKSALSNLIDNACKFSQDKSVQIFLRVKDKYIIVEFKDTGIGIDKPDLSRIFDPFFRAKNSINIYGNGLGLSLTERIVKIHKGIISVRSELNKGTTITIQIPIVA